MQINDSIKLFCVKYGISLSELARRLNKSPQAFSQKIQRGTITLDDLEEIAMVTGCKLDCSLVMTNGDKVKINL
ncbi:MAG TPA: XRE family transcriptional regulator [Clostridiales bacterium]|nr:XRE family transcriptional regulator [Clostridiales bacterium]